MPSSLNKVMLIGNLGKDAELRHTPSGTAVTNFSLATTFRYKNAQTGEWQDRTEWHDVVLWRGENVTPYLKKGKKVFVEGRLQTRSWEGQDGQRRYRTEVVCDPFGLMLLGGRDGQSGGAPGGYGGGQGRQGGYAGGQGSYSGGQGGYGGGTQAPSGPPPSAPQYGGGGSPASGGMSAPATPSASGGSVDDDDDIPF